jgi:hypothetical protein
MVSDESERNQISKSQPSTQRKSPERKRIRAGKMRTLTIIYKTCPVVSIFLECSEDLPLF